jgi:hypothetical protein
MTAQIFFFKMDIPSKSFENGHLVMNDLAETHTQYACKLYDIGGNNALGSLGICADGNN